jgi:hypothetical protein
MEMIGGRMGDDIENFMEIQHEYKVRFINNYTTE